MEKKLYSLQTRGLNSFYVIAEDPTSAEKKLRKELDAADYGFTDDRDVLSIDILSKEINRHDDGKLFFSSKDNLII